MISPCGASQLAAYGYTIDAAMPPALTNIETLLRSGTIDSQVYPNGPAAMPFAVFGGHWAASSVVLLPALASILGQRLGAGLVASIPHRDALLVFPRGDIRTRDAVRAFVLDNESDGAKPLTFGLFALAGDGPVALNETAD